MKRLFFILIPLFIGCSSPTTDPANASAPTPKFDSIAKDRLIDDVTRDIQGWHNRQFPDCKLSKVVSAKVLESKPDSSVEAWTIEGCSGRQFTYKLTIMPNSGFNSVFVGNIDGSGFKLK